MTEAHDRIERVLAAFGITEDDVLTEQQRHARGGKAPTAGLRSWSFGPGIVAAMLELVEARALKEAGHD